MSDETLKTLFYVSVVCVLNTYVILYTKFGDLLDKSCFRKVHRSTYHNKIRSICDGNFLSDIVANFLFRTSCG